MVKKQNSSFGVRLKKDMKRYRGAYLLVVPVVVFYLLFCYKPMYGVIIAFKDFSPAAGIWGSDWTGSFGFQHFIDFFEGHYFWRLLRNTLILSLYNLVAGFPIPIIVALILNETRPKFKKFAQTVLYAPHFISLVVLCGMIVSMFSKESGVVNTLLEMLGMERVYFMGEPKVFRHLYVWSGIWQQMGWNAINAYRSNGTR